MFTGNLSAASNRADLIIPWIIDDKDTGELIDLTDAVIDIAFTADGCSTPALTGSTTSGAITITSTGNFQIAFTPNQMNVLCAGSYKVGIRMVLDNVTTQLCVAEIQIVDGVVQP